MFLSLFNRLFLNLVGHFHLIVQRPHILPEKGHSECLIVSLSSQLDTGRIRLLSGIETDATISLKRVVMLVEDRDTISAGRL